MAAEDAQDNVLEAGSARARVARVYAEALLGAAMKQSNADSVDSVGEEMNELVSGVFGKNPTVAEFMGSPAVGRKTKIAALEAALPGRSSELLRGLFAVLAHNGRLDLFAGIAAAYHDLLDKRSGRVRVKVTAAAALSETQRAALSDTLVELLKQQPMLQVRVDPELLGGMIIQVGDRVIDTSVRTRLQTLCTLLLDKGSTNVVKANS